MMNDGQPATYMAHDGKLYQWPPPPMWWQGSDGRWYPPTEAHIRHDERQSSGGNGKYWLALAGMLAAILIIGAVARDRDERQQRDALAAELRLAGCTVFASGAELEIRSHYTNERCTDRVIAVASRLGMGNLDLTTLSARSDSHTLSLGGSGDNFVFTLTER